MSQTLRTLFVTSMLRDDGFHAERFYGANRHLKLFNMILVPLILTHQLLSFKKGGGQFKKCKRLRFCLSAHNDPGYIAH